LGEFRTVISDWH